MSKKEKKQRDGILRNSSLVKNRTDRMAGTYIGSTICVAAVTAVDSLVAGVSIGSAALAAIAAAGPLMAIAQILHCMLGVGIDKLMIRAIGKGKRKEADRIFGGVLIAVLALYLLVFIPVIKCERSLLGLYIEDPSLIDMVIVYTVPLLASAPVFEVFLCIERAFRVDGRAKLFVQRSIITNIANIFLALLMVSVLGWGLSGLAWSSVISTALGYLITLSHFFSKKRSVTPDFSVILSLKEWLYYVKEDLRLGGSATLDELLDGAAVSAQTAVISAVSGAGGLVIWAVFKALRGIVLSLVNGVSASVSVHAGLLYSEEDHDGVRYSLKAGLRLAMVISLAIMLLFICTAGTITDYYRVEEDLRTLCSQCLRIGCAVFPALAFLAVFTAYLPSVDKLKLVNILVIVQKGLIIVSAAIGFIVSLKAFFTVYVIGLWAAAFILLVLLARDRHWLVPAGNPESIADYSIRLLPGLISSMSEDAAEKLNACAYPKAFCSKVALVMEDSMNYIAQQNPDQDIRADIQMKRYEDGVQILIRDDGMAYSPLSSIAEADWEKPGDLETVVVLGLAADVNYDRMLDLNQLSLLVCLPSAADPAL